MNTENWLLAIAVLAVAISLIGLSVTYNAVSTLKNYMTGFASSGVVNVSIQSNAEINFTVDFINFGSGHVTSGTSAARLNTEGTVVNGTWSATNTPFHIENIGNSNVQMSVAFSKTASAFLGGSAGADQQMKVTDTAENACQSGELTTYTSIGTSSTTICSNFTFEAAHDELDLEVQLIIPSDAPDGTKTNTATVTYSAV